MTVLFEPALEAGFEVPIVVFAHYEHDNGHGDQDGENQGDPRPDSGSQGRQNGDPGGETTFEIPQGEDRGASGSEAEEEEGEDKVFHRCSFRLYCGRDSGQGQAGSAQKLYELIRKVPCIGELEKLRSFSYLVGAAKFVVDLS